MCEEEKHIVDGFVADHYEWGHSLAQKAYECIRTITDPEKPYTLEQLQVVAPERVIILTAKNPEEGVDDEPMECHIELVPTSPGCSLASLIGLCILYKLKRDIPQKRGFPKFSISIKPGTHDSAEAIAKQLNDKERRYAAMENPDILRALMASCPHVQEDECCGGGGCGGDH